MRKVLIGMGLSAALTGCSAVIPFVGVALDGSPEVEVQAKVTTNSGNVLPVADTPFTYVVYDKAYSGGSTESFKLKAQGSFRTDFDGKAVIQIPEGTLLLNGNYAIYGGKSSIYWKDALFHVPGFQRSRVFLSNSNGTVTNF